LNLTKAKIQSKTDPERCFRPFWNGNPKGLVTRLEVEERLRFYGFDKDSTEWAIVFSGGTVEVKLTVDSAEESYTYRVENVAS
jgi:hypothetical protein